MSLDTNLQDIIGRRFENPHLQGLGVELMTIDELSNKLPKMRLSKPERIDFFMLLLVTSGQGLHTVDFIQHPISSNTFIFVRPGQVQQWLLDSRYSGLVLLIQPDAIPSISNQQNSQFLSLLDWQVFSKLPSSVSSELLTAFSQLRIDIDTFNQSEDDIFLIRHHVFVMLLRIGRWQRELLATRGLPEQQIKIYHLFLKELEKHYSQQHHLAFYIERLGYSASTIRRACLAAEGRNAKLVIDRRIALEAKRLLVHSMLSIATIAHQLGFSEPSNFVKFFKRLVKVTPAKFRQQACPRDSSMSK